MTSVKEKIAQIMKKGITRDELKTIAEQVYKDRLTYSSRKPVNGKGRAITALNLIYYNQWIVGPYLRELRFKKLPWYKKLFGGQNYGIQPSRKASGNQKT